MSSSEQATPQSELDHLARKKVRRRLHLTTKEKVTDMSFPSTLVQDLAQQRYISALEADVAADKRPSLAQAPYAKDDTTMHVMQSLSYLAVKKSNSKSHNLVTASIGPLLQRSTVGHKNGITPELVALMDAINAVPPAAARQSKRKGLVAELSTLSIAGSSSSAQSTPLQLPNAESRLRKSVNGHLKALAAIVDDKEDMHITWALILEGGKLRSNSALPAFMIATPKGEKYQTRTLARTAFNQLLVLDTSVAYLAMYSMHRRKMISFVLKPEVRNTRHVGNEANINSLKTMIVDVSVQDALEYIMDAPPTSLVTE